MKDPYGWEMDAKTDTDTSKPLDHIHEYNSLGFCKKCGYSPPKQFDIIPEDNNPLPYEKLGMSIGKMVGEKQLAYGDSFGRAGQVLKVLYPDGIILDQYDDMLAVVRIIDKLFRVANNKGAFGESPFRDIAGYGILGASKEISK
jgi:hypothetical protein